MLEVTPECQIDENAIEERFVRSSGPGGQHVNKVSSAVQLRFFPDRTDLDDDVRNRLIELAGAKATRAGDIVITVQDSRRRKRNREEARRRLAHLIREALEEPKQRIETSPSVAVRKRRLQRKRNRSVLKKSRQKVSDDE